MLFFWEYETHVWKSLIRLPGTKDVTKTRTKKKSLIITSDEHEWIFLIARREWYQSHDRSVFFFRKKRGLHGSHETSEGIRFYDSWNGCIRRANEFFFFTRRGLNERRCWSFLSGTSGKLLFLLVSSARRFCFTRRSTKGDIMCITKNMIHRTRMLLIRTFSSCEKGELRTKNKESMFLYIWGDAKILVRNMGERWDSREKRAPKGDVLGSTSSEERNSRTWSSKLCHISLLHTDNSLASHKENRDISLCIRDRSISIRSENTNIFGEK